MHPTRVDMMLWIFGVNEIRTTVRKGEEIGVQSIKEEILVSKSHTDVVRIETLFKFEKNSTHQIDTTETMTSMNN